MNKKTMALAGAAGVLTTTPAAIALAADPVGTPATGPDTIRAELADHPTVRAQMRSLQHDRLLRRYRRLAKAAGEHRNEARFWYNGRLLKEIGRLRDELRSRQVGTTTAGAETPQLASIAACESGGDPHPIGRGARVPRQVPVHLPVVGGRRRPRRPGRRAGDRAGPPRRDADGALGDRQLAGLRLDNRHHPARES